MFYSNNIEGIEVLQKTLPDELQFWHKFGTICDLHYKHIFDEVYCDYISCIELLLTDAYENYKIKIFLYNVSGDLNFDVDNGFYSGLTIEDCSDWGYEKNCRFRISSLEQDIEFVLYCEKIKVELID